MSTSTTSSTATTNNTTQSKPVIDSLLSSLSDAAATASPIRPSTQQFNYSGVTYNPSRHNITGNNTDTAEQDVDDDTTDELYSEQQFRPRIKRSTITHNPKHPTTGVAKHISYDTQGNAITTTKVYLICRHDCGCKRRGSDIHLLAAPRACSSRGARHDHETNHNLHPFCDSNHGCWYLVSSNRTGSPHKRLTAQPPSPQPLVVSSVLPPIPSNVLDPDQSSDSHSTQSSPYSQSVLHPSQQQLSQTKHKSTKRPRNNHTQLNQQRGNTTVVVTQPNRMMSPFSPGDLPLPPGFVENERAESAASANAASTYQQQFKSPQSVPATGSIQHQIPKPAVPKELELPPAGGIARSSSAPSLAVLVGASNQLSPAKRTKISNSDSNDSLNLLSTLSMDQSGQPITAQHTPAIPPLPTNLPKHSVGASSHSTTSMISPTIKSELPPLHSRPSQQRTPTLQPLTLPGTNDPAKHETAMPPIERGVSAESDISDVSTATQVSRLSVQLPHTHETQKHDNNGKSAAELLSLASAVDMVE